MKEIKNKTDIIDIARDNFRKAMTFHRRGSGAKIPQFINRNSKKGYGAILKLLTNGNQPSRNAILTQINQRTVPGHYSTAFQSLLWSGFISYNRSEGYSLTDLGKKYVNAFM
jgi:hypothetical protein